MVVIDLIVVFAGVVVIVFIVANKVGILHMFVICLIVVIVSIVRLDVLFLLLGVIS